MHYLAILSFFLDYKWHSRFNSFIVVFSFIVDDQNRTECSGKKNIFVVWFLWLTNIYLIHSSIQIFDLVNIFFCFFKILPLCLHRKQRLENDEQNFLKSFWGWGEDVWLSFRTTLQLMLFRENVGMQNNLKYISVYLNAIR